MLIVDCPYCKTRVQAEELGAHEEVDDWTGEPTKTTLCRCTACAHCLVATQTLNPEAGEWGSAMRDWPSPPVYISWHVPSGARFSLEEAQRCMGASAYTAAVAMSGRAIEAVCRHHQTKNSYLGGGLQELRDRKIIDERLFEWGSAIHLERNAAAHADSDGEQYTAQDAEDIFKFALAICDYVFVLAAQFEEFKKRKAKRSEKSKNGQELLKILLDGAAKAQAEKDAEEATAAK